MAKRINRCVELLEQDQAIYYDGPHRAMCYLMRRRSQSMPDLGRLTECGMEHGCYRHDALPSTRAGLSMLDPRRSGHRTPAVIVEAP